MVFTIFPRPGKTPAHAPLPASANDARGPKDGKLSGQSKDAAAALPARKGADTEMGGWSREALRIEVAEEGSLSPSLENAALMFAHGNATAAAAALAHALETPERTQPMVWMCLFDLHARNGDRTAFEEQALRFVVQFERSAPAWDEMASRNVPVAAKSAVRAKPKSLLRGELTDPHAPVIVSMIEASRRKDVIPPRFDLDIAELNGVNDVCGTLLAGALASLRRKGATLSFRALDATIRRLSLPLVAGKATRKGQWYLVLELLQWAGQSELFDDRAVDFAVTFEISPPTLEPLTPAQRNVLTTQTTDKEVPAEDALEDDKIIWLGELKGASDNCLRTLTPEVVTTNPVVVDMREVLRVDFVCGGAIANAFTRLMAQAIDVHVVGASPMIQTLLQLTGTPAGLFAKTR